jgi:hypothetical protein
MVGLVLALCLHASGPLSAAVPPLVTADGDRFDVDGKKVSDPQFFGVRVDVGLPDGVGAAVLVLPVPWLGVHLAGLHNGAGAGLRIGLELVGFPSWRWFRPTLSADVGSFTGGDASFLAPLAPAEAQPLLRSTLSRLSYQFANAQVGFELGTKTFSFLLRAGLSYLDGSLGSPSAQVGTSTISTNGIRIHGVFPSARLGLMVCF